MLIDELQKTDLTQEERTALETLYKAFNEQTPDLLDQACAPDWQDIPLAPGQETGPAGLKKMMPVFFSAFPDLKMEIHEVIGSHGRAAVRGSLVGTHRGNLFGVPAPENADHTDRRALRSRQALMDALAKLLQKNDFDDLSIQEIADRADLTRATFYLHYQDKAALLQAMTTVRFSEMLKKRGLTSPKCAGGLKAIALGVCEYLGKVLDCQSSSKIPLERSVIPVIEGIFREGTEELQLAAGVDPDLYATTIAWAIYGTASRWAQTPNRRPAEQMAQVIEALLSPILQTVV